MKMKINVKVVSVIVSVILVMSLLVGCNEIEKAQKSVNGMFEAFRSLNLEAAKQYVNVEQFDNMSVSDNKFTKNQEVFMKLLFNKLQNKIVSSQRIDSNNVIVKTEITAIDMKPIFSEYIQEAMKIAFSNAFSTDKVSDEEMQKAMENKFTEIVNNPNVAMITNTVDIKVQKVDNAWKVVSDETLINAILGGLQEVAKSMEDAFNKIGE